MSALSIQPTYPIFTDIDGQPLEDGYVWIGAANLDPQTNPINVYWDAALTLPAAQPIRTLAGYPANSGTPARLYVNSDYSIRVMNKNGSVVYSAPAATERYSDVVVSGVNAEDVIYDPPFIGAVQTDVEAKLAQTVSVKDFGAVGDGVTDDTPAVQAAVTHCFTTGDQLYWPDGTYLTTASISNFHSVQHSGSGIVQRGSDTFAIEPTDSHKNTIYVSSNGSDSNDGLSNAQPRRTLSSCKSVIINTQPAQRGGTWEFKFAAGTYTDSTNFPVFPVFERPVRFIGTGTSKTPQTIFNGSGAAYQTAGMYFNNGANVVLQYLKFINFSSGYGVLAEKGGRIELYDCDAESCLIGFAAGYWSNITAERCYALNCSNAGFRVASNGTASFAPQSGLFADGNRAVGCAYGISITRNSYAHVDYNEITDCTEAGLLVEINSRTAVLGNDFKRNPVAIRCWTDGFISISNSVPNVFNQGSVSDRNTTIYQFRGGSGIVNNHGQAGTMNNSLFKFTTPTTVTGTATITQIGPNIWTLPAGWMVSEEKRMRLRVWGTVTTPADGTISLEWQIGSTATANATMPSGITDQTFLFEAEIIPTGPTSQKSIARITCGNNIVVTNSRTRAIDMLSADRVVQFFTDANGAGATHCSITVESIDFEVCG